MQRNSIFLSKCFLLKNESQEMYQLNLTLNSGITKKEHLSQVFFVKFNLCNIEKKSTFSRHQISRHQFFKP